jgi:hypothetical protein
MALAPATAVTPEVWRVSTFGEFADGTAERVAILHPGDVQLSPSYEEFSSVKDPAIWSLAESPDGKVLYAGTGNSAKIYKIASETESTTSEAKLFADLDGNAVYALLSGKSGEIYAGVSPGGNVYKITPDGAVTLVGSTDQSYIWAMTWSATGELILGTGDKGLLLSMDSSGKTMTIAKTGEKHILSLIADKAGKVHFGTAPGGWVAAVEGKSEFRVLYDSDLGEVKALAFDAEGNLFAGIVPSIQVEPKRDVPQPQAAGPSPKADKSSELVRISPNGLARVLAKTQNAAINTLFLAPSGLLIGTGEDGKLFELGYREDLDLVADLEGNDILALLNRKEGGVWIGMGNPGNVLVFPLGTNKGGTYASKPLDTGLSSQWGRITWKSSVPEGATLELQTRSGNTKEPDKHWSEWSDSLAILGVVESPPARFLQWRAKLGGNKEGKSAVLHEVEVVHQDINQPPQIEKLQIGDGSAAAESSSSQSAKAESPSSKTSSPTKTGSEGGSSGTPTSLPISWQATDPNGDSLIHDLHYRRVGETLWKEIEVDLKAAKFTWNTASLPDGDYEIRVQSSDRLANPPASAGSDRFRSESFRIDKTAPRVFEFTDQQPGAGTFSTSVRVKDETSRLSSVEVVVDGDEDHPQPLMPEDGLLDSSEETFKITLSGLSGGEHSLSVRARDEKGNTGAEPLLFSVP